MRRRCYNIAILFSWNFSVPMDFLVMDLLAMMLMNA